MNMNNWFLHEKINGHDNGYWEIISATKKPPIGELIKVRNVCGGQHFHTVTEEDELIFSTWETVLKQYFLDQTDSPWGWIDREGRFYGCDFMEHKFCADICFNMSELEAERRGYVKIYSDDSEGYYCSTLMTTAQKRTLDERGFIVEDDEVMWNE